VLAKEGKGGRKGRGEGGEGRGKREKGKGERMREAEGGNALAPSPPLKRGIKGICFCFASLKN
jgi:hypothetical protein